MGSVVLDSGVIIGLLSQADVHHDWAVAQLAASLERREELIISTVTVAEVLVRPARTRQEQLVLDDLRALRPSIVEVTEEVAVGAAGLRARHDSLRLPDALIAATALHLGADAIMTVDSRLGRLRIRGLRIVHPAGHPH